MKFGPTKFRLPGFFRKLLQIRQMKYVLLSVAFSVLIIGAAVIYGELSKRYEQEIQPPARTEQTTKTKPGTKVTNEKKNAEATGTGENTADSSLESASAVDPEKSLEKETEFRVQQSNLSAIPVKRLHKSHRRFPERHSHRRTRKNQIIQRILPEQQNRNKGCQI